MSDEKLYGWRARGLDGAKACEHGRQRRQCPECESASLDEELRIKDARIALLERAVEAASALVDDKADTAYNKHEDLCCTGCGSVTMEHYECAWPKLKAALAMIDTYRKGGDE